MRSLWLAHERALVLARYGGLSIGLWRPDRVLRCVHCLQAMVGAARLLAHLDGSKALLAVMASITERTHQQILLVLRGKHVPQKVVLGDLLLGLKLSIQH